MLDFLDSILAFAAIMLGVSLIVTVLVQTISGLLNLRGRALAHGLAELFAQANVEREQALALARRILCHPLISDSILHKPVAKDAPWYRRLAWWLSAPWVPASAVRKEELSRLLSRAKELRLELPYEVKDRLDAATLVIDEWFDAQMDRVSQTFAQSTRLVTIAISFILVFALHIDAAVLLERMFRDSETRAKVVASVGALEEHAKRLGAVPSPTTTPGTEPAAATARDPATPPNAANPLAHEIERATAEISTLRGELATAGVDILPKLAAQADLEQGIHAPGDYFPWNGEPASRHLLGILAAGALLSLGAPFWFNLLSQLANLRSVLANKEKQERTRAPRDAAG